MHAWCYQVTLIDALWTTYVVCNEKVEKCSPKFSVKLQREYPCFGAFRPPSNTKQTLPSIPHVPEIGLVCLVISEQLPDNLTKFRSSNSELAYKVI